MKFFEDFTCQEKKTGYTVCGDAYLCERRQDGTVFVLCDGIGSGIYANIAAISCANRIMELVRRGVSLRKASEMVASSMHKAREADIPFSAFSAAFVLPDGKFFVYTYEAPEAICMKNGSASVLKPRFYTAGYEVIGEATGELDYGDALILSSDGVTQAGLGHGFGMGIGSTGIAKFINQTYKQDDEIGSLPREILLMCSSLMDYKYEDDTTLALIHCREAEQLTILTGPPSKPAMDADCVEAFMASPGKKVVCGSTTADIVSRELGRTVEIVKLGAAIGSPPEYRIEGIELTTEGAIMLNQVYNILDEPPDSFSQNSVVEYMCLLLTQSDVINFFIGNAINQAHEDMLFKQVGVRVRKTTVKLISERLRAMGKLVIEKYY